MNPKMLMTMPWIVSLMLVGCSGPFGPGACSAFGHGTTSWAFAFVRLNGTIYQATKWPSTKVGRLLGQVTMHSGQEGHCETGTFSNAYPVGTKLYSVIGAPKQFEIAVLNKDHRTRLAVNEKLWMSVWNRTANSQSYRKLLAPLFPFTLLDQEPCRIPTGGIAGTTPLKGTCRADVAMHGSVVTATFKESWSPTQSHTWTFRGALKGPYTMHESGALAPQLRK